jgi:tetratricopeptide (TPR) repeat protein
MVSDDDLFYPFRASGHPLAREAEDFFRRAYELQMQGKLEEAIVLYQESIRLLPTAEAHTFLGWAYCHQGKVNEAIQECTRAIRVDPDFGNPYNDIGAYLIDLGRPAEAIPWLKKAMQARRYQPRHFPHVNLARVYIILGRLEEALEELKLSLTIEPQNPSARRELKRLLSRFN